MPKPSPTASHVHWPAGTTWFQAWEAIRWDAKCQRWRCLLNGMFVSKAYAGHVGMMARLEVVRAVAQCQAARVARAIRRRHKDGNVRHGKTADEARARREFQILYL